MRRLFLKTSFLLFKWNLSHFWHAEVFCSQQELLHHIRHRLSSSQLEMNTRSKFTSLIPFKDMFDCNVPSTPFDALLRCMTELRKLRDGRLLRQLLAPRLFFEPTLPPSGLM